MASRPRAVTLSSMASMEKSAYTGSKTPMGILRRFTGFADAPELCAAESFAIREVTMGAGEFPEGLAAEASATPQLRRSPRGTFASIQLGRHVGARAPGPIADAAGFEETGRIRASQLDVSRLLDWGGSDRSAF